MKISQVMCITRYFILILSIRKKKEDIGPAFRYSFKMNDATYTAISVKQKDDERSNSSKVIWQRSDAIKSRFQFDLK